MIVQLGGQTPLNLARALQEAGVKILGTSPDSIDAAEDRQRFAQLAAGVGDPTAGHGTATARNEAREVAAEIGFPVVVRPSYVLGGRTCKSCTTWHTRPILATAVDVAKTVLS